MNETHIETLHGILNPERRQPGAQQVCNLLAQIHKYSLDITDSWCTKTVTEIAFSEVRALLKRTSGFTFEAKSLWLENIEEFSISKFGDKMKQLAPVLWNLIGTLLQSNPRERQAHLNAVAMLEEGGDQALVVMESLGGLGMGNSDELEELDNEVDMPENLTDPQVVMVVFLSNSAIPSHPDRIKLIPTYRSMSSSLFLSQGFPIVRCRIH